MNNGMVQGFSCEVFVRMYSKAVIAQLVNVILKDTFSEGLIVLEKMLKHGFGD